MKIISEKEFKELDLASRNGKRASKWFKVFVDLPPHKAVIILREEWDLKTSVKDYASFIRRRSNPPTFLKYSVLKDGSGWVIRNFE